MVGRLAAIVSELLQYRRSVPAPRTELPFPPLRAMLTDVLEEGRRKPLIHLVLDVDITGARPEGVSVTAWVGKAFADAVNEDRSMQALRCGSKLVVFDDVDVCFMVERELEGATMPVAFIVRSVQAKDAAAIHAALQGAKGTAGPSSFQRQFFTLPRWVRRLLWGVVRRDPGLVKELMGTVGLTSMGMYASGSAVVLPVSPGTLALSIGTIEARDGRSILHLNLTADHDIIDGAPLMRFAERLQSQIRGQALYS